MAERLLADGGAAVLNTLCFENARGLFGKDDDSGKPRKRRMSEALARRHLSVVGSPAAMEAALNWYRSAFAGGSTLARPDVPKITVPTLYLWGREDMSVGEMAATATKDFVSASYAFVPIDGAGHFLAEEVPEPVTSLLLAHLAENRN
jgi:pimeloyl-ACP methyl ester carboxylesterase